jgi:hypothetical protein
MNSNGETRRRVKCLEALGPGGLQRLVSSLFDTWAGRTTPDRGLGLLAGAMSEEKRSREALEKVRGAQTHAAISMCLT